MMLENLDGFALSWLVCFVQELHAMKQENTQIEYDKGTRNNLLEYLRSLDPDMVMLSDLLFEIISFIILQLS